MFQSLVSFLPQHVVDDIIAYPNTSPIGRELRMPSVALFADVSGFTAISEALGKTGRGGTEELTAILNSYFNPMIDLIRSYGGIICKFGGDAMTVLFPFDESSKADTVRRAIQCAVDMQEDMHRYEAIPTSQGTFSLAMKAGLSIGTAFCTSVGNPQVRLEYIIAGELLDLCADAEHHANKGDVVIQDVLLENAGEIEILEHFEEGFTRIASLKQPAHKIVLKPHADFSEIGVEGYMNYLHPAIAERLFVGQSAFINEHRKVTVIFVRFDGFDYNHDPEIGTKLQRYLSAVFEIVDRYGGYVNKVDMGDKGSKYIVLFGAPVAHENDEERALRCALELTRLTDAKVRIGVNTGFTFCGQVGSPVRQEYTVMGDAVNLSARLMQHAQTGQIVASQVTREPTRQEFSWEEHAPIMVKGKTQPISIAILQNINRFREIGLHEPDYQLPMIGRRTELGIAQEKIDLSLEGQGQIIGVSAEAGMGKSRLAAEIIRTAQEAGKSAFGGECLSYGSNSSYLVWHTIWQGLLEMDPRSSDEDQLNHLQDLLTLINPDLVQRMPLLSAILNMDIPGNSMIDSLDPKVRQDILNSLLLYCLQWISRSSPLLLVLEDCQWIDPLSLELLGFIGRNIADMPVTILMLYRPPSTGQTFANPAQQLPHFTELHLTEFSPREASQLIELKLLQLFGDAAELPYELIERIADRAQGNPFYLEELINLIHDEGIDPQDIDALNSMHLPDTLHKLIVSRVDRLSEQEKLTLKIASVIGRLFRASWLWGSYAEIGDPEHVKQQLLSLHDVEITLEDKPEPELEYLFKHVLTQEVIYESLAFSTRETLHERIGDYIEKSYLNNLTPYVDILAHHFGHTRNNTKKIQYFRMAGDAAKKVYANEAAINYYRTLLPLLPDADLSEVRRNLGEVLQLTGSWDEAEEHYRIALQTAPNNTRNHAWAQTLLGNLLMFAKSPADAESWLENARKEFEGLDDIRGLGRALKFLTIAYLHQRKYDDAQRCAEQQIALATQHNDSLGLHEAQMNLSWIHLDRGEIETAQRLIESSLKIAIDQHYLYGVTAASSDMAGLYYAMGDYAKAIDYLVQGLRAAEEIGFLQGIGQIVLNMGAIYQKRNYEQALACYCYALNVFRQLGDFVNMLIALYNIADVLVKQQRDDKADELFQHVKQLSEALELTSSIYDMLYYQAEFYTQQERFEEAQAINSQVMAIAADSGDATIQFKAAVLSFRLQAVLGISSTADSVQALEALLADLEDESQQAMVNYMIWQIEPAHAHAKDQAFTLYRQLYTQSPDLDYRQKYLDLTGEHLPLPSSLPPLRTNITQEALQLDSLLHQTFELVEKRVGEA